jgi:hypothetical protein
VLAAAAAATDQRLFQEPFFLEKSKKVQKTIDKPSVHA